MRKTFNTPEEFYKNAMLQIQEVIGNKLKMLGIEAFEIPFLIDMQDLNRHTEDEVDGVIVETYEYRGIKLIEVEWTGNGIKQKDIHKDERDFNRDLW